MKLVYFSWVRQQLGTGEETIDVPTAVKTVGDLVAWLATRGPEYEAVFAEPKRLKTARNQAYVTFHEPVEADDEVAFFPPVTGG